MNSATRFCLKGESIYRWVAAIAPHLNGETTLEEMCAPLGEDQRRQVIQLVTLMIKSGLARACADEDVTLLPEKIRCGFRRQIELIHHYNDRPLERFKRFRESDVLLVGSGLPLISLAVCLLRNGLKKVKIAPVSRLSLVEVESEIEALDRLGIESSIEIVTCDSSNFEGPTRLDLVIYCSDQPNLKEIYSLNASCWGKKRLFLPGYAFSGRNILGPLVKSGRRGCWLCAQMRWSSNADHHLRSALWKGIALGAVVAEKYTSFTTTERMLGHALGYEAFKIICGHLNPETDHAVLFQNLLTLDQHSASFMPHPLCPTCSEEDQLDRISRLSYIASGHYDRGPQLVEDHSPYVDPTLGLFRGFAPEDEVPQTPIKTSLLVVGHPVDSSPFPFRIAAFDIRSSSAAAVRAFESGFKYYVDSLPDERRMKFDTKEGLAASGLSVVDPSALSTWTGAEYQSTSPIAWLPAHSVLTGKIHYLHAGAIYPFSTFNRSGLYTRCSAGWGSGKTIEAVLIDGLLSALSYEALVALSADDARAGLISFELVRAMGSDQEDLLVLLGEMGCSVQLLEISNGLPASIVLAAANDRLHDDNLHYAVGTGVSLAHALGQALLDLAGYVQLARAGVSFDDTMRVSFHDVLPLEGIYPAPLFSADHIPWTIDSIKGSLSSVERDAFFIDTTTSDIWERGGPLTARVILTRPSSGAAIGIVNGPPGK